MTDPLAGTRIWSPGQRVRLVGMRRDLVDGPCGTVVRESDKGTDVRWDRTYRRIDGRFVKVESVHPDALEGI